MTDFDPENPDIHHRMGFTLILYYWRITIPLIVLVVSLGIALDRWGYDGRSILHIGLGVPLFAAFLYERRAKLKEAEAERNTRVDD